MPDLFNLNHLVKSENKTVQFTRNILAGVYTNFPEITNTFFKLPYFIGELEPPESDRGGFQSICTTHYFQAPYTFWALYGLYEKGYYLEALILYRHLVESFIQIRYFDRYPEKTISQIKRKNFKVMFDEFAPGFYEKTYAPILCEAAHGVFLKDIQRFDRKADSIGRTRMGCEFNSFFASSVMNQTFALLFGYLNIYDSVFPKNTLKSDSIVYRNLSKAKKWLVSAMASHKKRISQKPDTL